MNIEDLSKSLPNGFHDSMMKSLELDYLGKTIRIGLDIWVGDLSSSDALLREKYREAMLTINRFDFCVIDPPDEKYPYLDEGPLEIDIGMGQPSTDPKVLPKGSPDSFLFHIWVNDWNAFIRISAQSAELKML